MSKIRWFVLLAFLLTLLHEPQVAIAGECGKESDYPHCDDGKVANGYWWRDLAFVPYYPTIDSWFIPSPIWVTGYAVFYDYAIMEATAKSRGFDLTGYLDGVALMPPSDIGLTVWLKPMGGKWEGPFLVVDSATRGDIVPLILYRHEVVEVGNKTAKRWGMVDSQGKVKSWRISVEVSKVNPACLEGQRSVDYHTWWLSKVVAASSIYAKTPLYQFPTTWRLNGLWVTFNQPEVLVAGVRCNSLTGTLETNP